MVTAVVWWYRSLLTAVSLLTTVVQFLVNCGSAVVQVSVNCGSVVVQVSVNCGVSINCSAAALW